MISDDNNNLHDSIDNQDDKADLKSKTQLKREHEKIQKFVQTLLDAKRGQIEKLSLPDEVKQDILDAQSMSKGARKREIKYLAKVIQGNAIELMAEYQELLRPHQDQTRQFHIIEQLRDELLSDDKSVADAALQNLLKEHKLEAQHLRQLIRQARYEIANNKTPKSSRQLFRYLTQQIT